MRVYRVEFAAAAERQVLEIGGWWRINRQEAPGLFHQELFQAAERLSEAPHAGSRYQAPRPAGVRRLLLRRTGYHLYYTVDEEKGLVTVRAVWHAARGRPPRLS